jgi:hypothetical protein
LGHVAIARLLIQGGVSINRPVGANAGWAQQSDAQLSTAIQWVKISFARMLIASGAVVHYNNGGRTALWLACNHGDKAIVRSLIERWAGVNICSSCYPFTARSAPVVTRGRGHIAIQRLLVENGAREVEASDMLLIHILNRFLG